LSSTRSVFTTKSFFDNLPIDELCDGLCVATTVALTRDAADVSGIAYVMEADAEEVEQILG
jgi:hypothetical protein